MPLRRRTLNATSFSLYLLHSHEFNTDLSEELCKSFPVFPLHRVFSHPFQNKLNHWTLFHWVFFLTLQTLSFLHAFSRYWDIFIHSVYNSRRTGELNFAMLQEFCNLHLQLLKFNLIDKQCMGHGFSNSGGLSCCGWWGKLNYYFLFSFSISLYDIVHKNDNWKCMYSIDSLSKSILKYITKIFHFFESDKKHFLLEDLWAARGGEQHLIFSRQNRNFELHQFIIILLSFWNIKIQ